MAEEARETGENIRHASIILPHLLLCVFTQFMYAGAQVAIASMLIFYVSDVDHFSDSRESILLSAGQGRFTVGRFKALLCPKSSVLIS